MRRTAASLLTFALLLGVAEHAPACPNCKEAVAAQPDEVGDVKNGYSYSVLFMMAMPFSLLGLGSFMVVRAAKRGVLPEL